VSYVGGQRQFELALQYNCYDRYNWDNGKSVELAGITVTDKFMGGSTASGSVKRLIALAPSRGAGWQAGATIPAGQLHAPGGRA
jgi:hypothetical protein